MAVARKVAIACLVAIGALAAAGRAHGEADTPIFPVEIKATQPESYVHVRGAGRDLPCGERCVLELPRHDYRVIVRDVDGNESATVTPPDHGMRTFGIVSGLTGVAVAAVGAVVLLAALWLRAVERIDCDGMACTSDDVPPWMWYGGGIAVAAGAALGVTGLILWRQNAHADVRVDAFAPPPDKDAGVRLAPVAGRQWAGLALTGRF